MKESVNVHEAKTHFFRLLARVNQGEEIIIAKAGKPVARIVPYAFQTLPIRMEHSLHLGKLPTLHKDPFDRLLIAQAQFENIPILTSDLMIARYPVEVVWS